MDEPAILAVIRTGRRLEKLAQPERWARVLWLRFGDGSPRTQTDVAADLGISRSRVDQIEYRALRWLRDMSRRRDVLLLAPEGTRLARALWGDDWFPDAPSPDA